MAKKKSKKQKEKNLSKGRLIGSFVVIILILGGLAVIMRSSNALVATEGDTVQFSYVTKLSNGTIIAESTRTGTIGSGDMKIQFDEALAGARIGETIEVVLEPKDAYGEYDISKIRQTGRYWAIDRKNEYTLSVVEANIIRGELAIGEEILLRDMDWPVIVEEIKDETVVVKHNPVNGSLYFPLNIPFSIKIIGITEDMITIENIATIGREITIDSSSATVIGIEENVITYDMNHQLAGETLTFSITILDIIKTE